MDRTCSTNREKRTAYRILVVNPEGKRQQERQRRRWADIKMDSAKIDWGSLDWINLALEQ
jgi:hypothetical protein